MVSCRIGFLFFRVDSFSGFWLSGVVAFFIIFLWKAFYSRLINPFLLFSHLSLELMKNGFLGCVCVVGFLWNWKWFHL